MPRFFFDYQLIPDSPTRSPADEEGLEFDSTDTALREAATAMAEMARDLLPHLAHREIVIAIRDEAGPVGTARITFELTKSR
jgi:hypothetical protein